MASLSHFSTSVICKNPARSIVGPFDQYIWKIIAKFCDVSTTSHLQRTDPLLYRLLKRQKLNIEAFKTGEVVNDPIEILGLKLLRLARFNEQKITVTIRVRTANRADTPRTLKTLVYTKAIEISACGWIQHVTMDAVDILLRGSYNQIKRWFKEISQLVVMSKNMHYIDVNINNTLCEYTSFDILRSTYEAKRPHSSEGQKYKSAFEDISVHSEPCSTVSDYEEMTYRDLLAKIRAESDYNRNFPVRAFFKQYCWNIIFFLGVIVAILIAK